MDSQSKNQQSDELNQSKFLSEHINLQEQPTEEQIFDRAQQLQIDDLGLAKESLLKELDPQWRPYINRRQNIFYINLQEQKAFIDHPIDMEIKITYAIKNKKRIPTFKQYKLSEVSENPALIHEEIRKYSMSHHELNIVYEQSQQQSMRRQTKITEQADLDLDYTAIESQVKRQTQRYARELSLTLQTQMISYRKDKQRQYQTLQRQHKDYLKQRKEKRLQELQESNQKEWMAKNEFNFNKSIDNIRLQFQNKKGKLQSLYDQEEEILVRMHGRNQSAEDVRIFHKEKVINMKKNLLNQVQRDTDAEFRMKLGASLNQAVQQFNKTVMRYTSTKINYKQTMERGFQAFNQEEKINAQTIKPKRKHSIFGLDLNKGKEKLQEKRSLLNVNEPVWCNNSYMVDYQGTNYKYTGKTSLPLRMMKRIL